MLELSTVLVNYGLTKSFLRKCVECGVLAVSNGQKKLKGVNVEFRAEEVVAKGEALRKYHKQSRVFNCQELLKLV